MPHNTFATSGLDLVGQCIDNGRIQFLSVLGVGAYGVVYLAVDLHAATPVYLAVKCLLRAGLDGRQRHFQRREIALHQLASRHPNIVTMHKVLEEGDFVYVIMDYCDDGDLFGMITERQKYIGKDDLIKKVFLQLVDAVQYLHSLGIFHRDLKPENILCTKDGERICIADFGLATSERTSTDFGCGSTFYLSPECQGGLFDRIEKYGTEGNDIWSLGVILVNLTCGRNPWRQACANDETFRAFVQNPNFLKTILPISSDCNRILKSLFALDPNDRIPLAELRNRVLAVKSFTLSDEELLHAHSAARAAAAAVRPPQAYKPKAESSRPKSPRSPKRKHHPHVWEPEYRKKSVEFTPVTIEVEDWSSRPVGGRPSIDTPSLEDEMTDGNESRSSSSAGLSLPPTPEFNPADRVVPRDGQKRVADWDVPVKDFRLGAPSHANSDFVL